jgi:lysosomal Pro-X carboxypeptidase
MLATWLRIKYPGAIDGALAASAPVVSFLGQAPPYDQGSYASQVTRDAVSGGDASTTCQANIAKAWQAIFRLNGTAEGRASLDSIFRLCEDSKVAKIGALTLASWLQSSFDYMSMGSYPFPSSYILNGKGFLPAFPMHKACNSTLSREQLSETELLEGLRDAAGIFYNYTGAGVKCFDTHGSANNATKRDALFWGYLYCAGILQPMSRTCENLSNSPFCPLF